MILQEGRVPKPDIINVYSGGKTKQLLPDDENFEKVWNVIHGFINSKCLSYSVVMSGVERDNEFIEELKYNITCCEFKYNKIIRESDEKEWNGIFFEFYNTWSSYYSKYRVSSEGVSFDDNKNYVIHIYGEPLIGQLLYTNSVLSSCVK